MEEQLKKTGLEAFHKAYDKYLLKPLLGIVLEYAPYNWQIVDVCRHLQPLNLPPVVFGAHTMDFKRKKKAYGFNVKRSEPNKYPLFFVRVPRDTTLDNWHIIPRFPPNYETKYDLFCERDCIKEQKIVVLDWENGKTNTFAAPFTFANHTVRWGHRRGDVCLFRAGDAWDSKWKVFAFNLITGKVKEPIIICEEECCRNPVWSPYGGIMEVSGFAKIYRKHGRNPSDTLGTVTRQSDDHNFTVVHSENESVFVQTNYTYRGEPKIIRITFGWMFGAIQLVWNGP
jgi:hypothetical protein